MGLRVTKKKQVGWANSALTAPTSFGQVCAIPPPLFLRLLLPLLPLLVATSTNNAMDWHANHAHCDAILPAQ